MDIARLYLDAYAPDPERVAEHRKGVCLQTDDELHMSICAAEHLVWLAQERDIICDMEMVAAIRLACQQELEFRAERNYQYRDYQPALFERAFLDDLKRRLSLAHEIGQALDLRKSGKNFVARCPFHSPDRHPSFTVFSETNSYYCFGCGAYGDIFSWIRHAGDMTFPEAVRLVARRCGVRLPARAPEAPRESFSTPTSAKRGATPGSQGHTRWEAGIRFEYREGTVTAW